MLGFFNGKGFTKPSRNHTRDYDTRVYSIHHSRPLSETLFSLLLHVEFSYVNIKFFFVKYSNSNVTTHGNKEELITFCVIDIQIPAVEAIYSLFFVLT